MPLVIKDIKDNPELYSGKKIIFPGQVSFSETADCASFSIMRMRMVCCAADLQPIGFSCSYTHAPNLREKSWRKVFRILNVRMSGKRKEPFIDVISVIPMQKPEPEYLYPRIVN